MSPKVCETKTKTFMLLKKVIVNVIHMNGAMSHTRDTVTLYDEQI